MKEEMQRKKNPITSNEDNRKNIPLILHGSRPIFAAARLRSPLQQGEPDLMEKKFPSLQCRSSGTHKNQVIQSRLTM
jgi:hypothetical protein